MLCRSFTVSHGKMQSGMRITDGHRIQKGQLDNIHGNETKRALAWQRCQRNELRLLLQCPGLGMTQDHTSTRSQVFEIGTSCVSYRQLFCQCMPSHMPSVSSTPGIGMHFLLAWRDKINHLMHAIVCKCCFVCLRSRAAMARGRVRTKRLRKCQKGK